MRLFRKKKTYDDTVSPHDAKVAELLALHGVNVVFDIGANLGQYARRLRAAGFTGKIVSFEPLSRNHETLLAQSAADPNWQIAPRMGVGDENGTITMNVSEHHDMSSALSLETAALTALPKSRVVATETADVRTLDSLISEFTNPGDTLFVKVDTQGYEMNVLTGAAQSLKNHRMAGWQMELSLLPLYRGEKTFEEIAAYLKSAGYEAHYIIPGYFSKKLNRQLQVDGVFFHA
jgi:FkbM family methyltransferase